MGNKLCAGKSSNVKNEVVVFKRQVASQKLGRYTFDFIPGYREACMEALKAAEQKKGSPPFVLEICYAWTS